MELKLRTILNSRGQKTIEAEIKDNGLRFLASTPSGASTGEKEVMPLALEGAEKGIIRVNKVLNEIKKVKIDSFFDLEEIEKILEEVDPSENKQLIGGNTILAIEYVLLKYYSYKNGKRVWEFIYDSLNNLNNKNKINFPIPLGNVIGGGAHSSNSIDIQEILLLPNYSQFSENYLINAKIHKEIKEVFSRKLVSFIAAKTDEGAWALNTNNEWPLTQLHQLIKNNNYNVNIGLDMAASQLYDGEQYIYKKDKKVYSKEEQYYYILELIERYNLKYLEDPVEENDEEGFNYLRKKSKNTWIIGDDFICTNPSILKNRIKYIDGSIVKPNQVGSLVKTFEVVDMLKKNDKVVILSHRSGETEDEILAHLALGFQSDLIKSGIVGGERTVKLNELLRLEEDYSKQLL